MKIFQKELVRCGRRQVLPVSKPRTTTFDVETTYAEVIREKKNHARKYHGPDSQLYSAIYPLVCIMKVFGLAPYDFRGDEIVPSKACLLFSFVFLALYCYILYIVNLRLISVKRKKAFLNVVETVKVTINYFVAMYELVATIFTRKALSQVWNAQQDFDERLSQLGYPRKETKTEIAMWTLLISQIVVWTAVNQSGMYAFEESWLFNVSYMFIYIGTAISVYKFIGMASFLGQRFHQLNRIAKENLPPSVGYKSSTVSRQTIQDLHNALMLFSETLGSLYSWSLLFWVGNLSVHSISNLYFIIDNTTLTVCKDITWPLILNMWCWLIGFVMQLLAIHVACDYTITEANFMGAILVEWEARTIRRFPHDDSVLTSLSFLNRRLRFSAGGLFDIKLSLLCTIVGGMSTYLIILLQYL